jgi:DNA-binding MarR family transcriptional regulator
VNVVEARTEYAIDVERRERAVELAQAYLKRRRARDKLFPTELLGAEPGWEILVDLFVWEGRNHQVSVSSACIASQGPPTTGLRYIDYLANAGLLYRQQDPFDKRRRYLRLKDQTAQRIEDWLIESFDEPMTAARLSAEEYPIAPQSDRSEVHPEAYDLALLSQLREDIATIAKISANYGVMVSHVGA